MRLANSRVRTKVTAVIVSLTALWVFAAWVTVRDGVNLLWVQQLDKNVAQPIDVLLPELQVERRLSAIYLAQRSAGNQKALNDQRVKTDQAITALARLSASGSVDWAASDTLKHRLSGSIQSLNELTTTRESVNFGVVDLTKPDDKYSVIIASLFQVYDSLATLDDDEFARNTRALIALNRAREILSKEDSLLAGSLARRKFADLEYLRFSQTVGAFRHDYAEAANELEYTDPAAFRSLEASKGLTDLEKLEDTAINRGFPSKRVLVSPQDWDRASSQALADLNTTVNDAGDRLVDRAMPIAIGVGVRLALAGGLGLFAVIASIILSITTARHLVRQLERLKRAAHELSDERLPSIVERLGRGEKVDVETEAPKLEFGVDDIGQVGQAFNTVQETAIRVAVEQAELRRSIRDILLSLARRSQALVHRQLTLLDAMERREIDTEELQDLFRVDHLATRMRRNAENLIILSGSTAARGWRRPVPMVDVVRSAVAEVEDYTRVAVLPIDEVALTGRAVGDLAHLLAELIENAVSFSPPYTVAQISGHMVASGYAIEIEDRGLGMSDESLDQINQRIADPPEFNLSSSAQLGLYVVGRLAERYQVQVTLKRSPYGGTTAVVVIPRELIEEGEADAPARSAQPLISVGTATVHDYAELSQGPVPEPTPVVTPVTEPVTEATTPSGLPLRVPQASLAAPLREEQAEPVQTEEDPGRSPEEIRKIVGAFQSGSLRGRSDATASEKSESETE